MKLWSQWTRKSGGWVERKRRFQKMFSERFLSPKVPALAGATIPETRGTTSPRGGK